MKDNKGFSSIYTILFLAVFIPFACFFTIDYPHFMSMNRKIKATLDNASSTAITQINEQKASNGVLEIDEAEATAIALKVVRETFNLNNDLSVKDERSISNTPDLKVVVINDINKVPNYTTPNGKFVFKNPSVLIYGEFPVKAQFFKSSERKIKYTSVSQVQFRK